MQQLYSSRVVRGYVADLIEGAGYGTQAELARHLGVPVQTVNKWARRSTCPLQHNWPGIEEFFDLEPGTIAGVGGVTEQVLSDAETALLNAPELSDDNREVVLRVYRALRSGGA